MTDQVLTADQGLDRGVGGGAPQLTQVLPRVLAELQVGLEGRAAERLHGGHADRVQLAGDREDLPGPEPAAQERLVAVAEGGVGEPESGRLRRRRCLAGPGHPYLLASAWRFSRWRLATAGSTTPRTRAANQAAFLAPASPIAIVATGIPAGIWTIE